MKSVIEAMYVRRSTRVFNEKKVSQIDIDRLLQCAMASPSARNKQPWEFYILNGEQMNMFKELSVHNTNAKQGILLCGNTNDFLEVLSEYWYQDLSAATTSITIAASGIDIHNCWIGVMPNEVKINKIKDYLNLPSNHIPFSIVALGYSDVTNEPRSQYNKDKIH